MKNQWVWISLQSVQMEVRSPGFRMQLVTFFVHLTTDILAEHCVRLVNVWLICPCRFENSRQNRTNRRCDPTPTYWSPERAGWVLVPVYIFARSILCVEVRWQNFWMWFDAFKCEWFLTDGLMYHRRNPRWRWGWWWWKLGTHEAPSCYWNARSTSGTYGYSDLSQSLAQYPGLPSTKRSRSRTGERTDSVPTGALEYVIMWKAFYFILNEYVVHWSRWSMHVFFQRFFRIYSLR